MIEDVGDKTEDTTPRRREEARRQGLVARSADLTTAAALTAALLLLRWTGADLVRAMKALVERGLSGQGQSLYVEVDAAALGIGRAMLPLLGGMAVVALGVNLAQAGFVIGGKRQRRGRGRMLDEAAWARLGMNVLKLVVVGAAAWWAIGDRLGQIVSVESRGMGQLLVSGAGLVYAIGLRVGLALLGLAVLDYGYQYWRRERSLRMTRQEVKEELRRMEGDPKLKLRRRQAALQMGVHRLLGDVAAADVVIIDGADTAVAVKYGAGMTAPKVTAKGRGAIALRIRQIAAGHGVAIFERRPLARVLFRRGDAAREIPGECFAEVADVLAYARQVAQSTPMRRSA
jgi:flagellar biosynthesis protein FlhB